MADEIKKFITIILNIRGSKEAGEESDKFFKKQHAGMDQAKKDASEGDDKIISFLGRWKSELMLIGGAVAGIYALVRYSSVANTMMDMMGKSVGFLADLILIHLLPGVLWLTSWILWLAKAFQSLPEILKDVIAWTVGGIVVWGLASKALSAMGMSAGAAGLLLSALAGLAIGISVVLILKQAGVWNDISDFIGKAKATFLNFTDNIRIIWHNAWVANFAMFNSLWNASLGTLTGIKLPNIDDMMKSPSTGYWSDQTDMRAGTDLEAYMKMHPELSDQEGQNALFGGMSWMAYAAKYRRDYPNNAAYAYKGAATPEQVADLDKADRSNWMGGIADLRDFGMWLNNRNATLPGPPGGGGMTEYPTPTGDGISPIKKPSQFNVTISNLELNPNAPGNKDFTDEILKKVNQSQSIGQQRGNFY